MYRWVTPRGNGRPGRGGYPAVPATASGEARASAAGVVARPGGDLMAHGQDLDVLDLWGSKTRLPAAISGGMSARYSRHRCLRPPPQRIAAAGSRAELAGLWPTGHRARLGDSPTRCRSNHQDRTWSATACQQRAIEQRPQFGPRDGQQTTGVTDRANYVNPGPGTPGPRAGCRERTRPRFCTRAVGQSRDACGPALDAADNHRLDTPLPSLRDARAS